MLNSRMPYLQSLREREQNKYSPGPCARINCQKAHSPGSAGSLRMLWVSKAAARPSCLWLIRMNWESRPCAELWLLLHCSKMGLSYHHMSSFLPLIKIVYEVSTQSNSVSLRFDTARSSRIVNQHLDSVHPRTEESKKSRPGPAL